MCFQDGLIVFTSFRIMIDLRDGESVNAIAPAVKVDYLVPTNCSLSALALFPMNKSVLLTCYLANSG